MIVAWLSPWYVFERHAMFPVADSSQNDFILMAHHHENGDDFVHEEKSPSPADPDTASQSSALHRSSKDTLPTPQGHKLTSVEDVQELAALTKHVIMTIETKSYLHNLVVFLRMHRAVQKGASPAATTYLEHLSK